MKYISFSADEDAAAVSMTTTPSCHYMLPLPDAAMRTMRPPPSSPLPVLCVYCVSLDPCCYCNTHPSSGIHSEIPPWDLRRSVVIRGAIKGLKTGGMWKNTNRVGRGRGGSWPIYKKLNRKWIFIFQYQEGESQKFEVFPHSDSSDSSPKGWKSGLLGQIETLGVHQNQECYSDFGLDKGRKKESRQGF